MKNEVSGDAAKREAVASLVHDLANHATVLAESVRMLKDGAAGADSDEAMAAMDEAATAVVEISKGLSAWVCADQGECRAAAEGQG